MATIKYYKTDEEITPVSQRLVIIFRPEFNIANPTKLTLDQAVYLASFFQTAVINGCVFETSSELGIIDFRRHLEHFKDYT